jgi:hypothetical protein
MSTITGPNAVTNGLILDVDMGNTAKSWLGAPATNLSPGTYAVFNATVTSYTGSDPNGTFLANTVTSSSAFANATINNTMSVTNDSSTYTFSVYVKAGTLHSYRHRIPFTGGTTALGYSVDVNLSTGTITSAEAGYSAASITSVGNGWYRVSISAANNSTGNTGAGFQIYPGALESGATGTLYVYGAQYEKNPFATPYSSTSDPTNLLTYSQDFTNAVWTKYGTGTSVIGTNALAPDGTLSACTVTASVAGGLSAITTNVGLSTLTYTWSCYLKAGTASAVQLYCYNLTGGGSAFHANFDVATGIMSSPAANGTGILYSSSISSVGNGWYRCVISGNCNIAGSMGCVVYTPVGTVLFWGAQLETGTSVSSYKPKPNARTNVQSVLDLTGQNILTANSLTYNSDGTYSFNGTTDYITTGTNSALQPSYVTMEAWVKQTNNSQSISFIGGSGDTGSHGYWLNVVNGTNPTFSTGNGSTVNQLLGTAFNYNTIVHIAGTYDGLTTAVYINGVLAGSNTNTTGPLNFTTVPVNLYIGQLNGTGSTSVRYFTGNIYSVRLYNRALSADEVKQNFQALRGRYGV